MIYIGNIISNKMQRVNPVCTSDFAISNSPAEMNSRMDCVNEARKRVVMEEVADFNSANSIFYSQIQYMITNK